MVRVHKRASKRVSTKQKSKITKKVREHHRKSKKLAKKDPTWKSKKKVDPGIPNSYPYKEQLLNEIEQKRIAAEAAKRQAKGSHRFTESTREDEEEMPIVEDDRDEQEDSPKSKASVPKMYKGSLKAFYDSVERITTLLLLDARDPGTWRLEEVENMMQSKDQAFAIVLTKCDLVPLEVVAAWSAHFLSQDSGPIFPICSPEAAKHGKKARSGGGIAPLIKYINNPNSAQGGKTQTVALLGFENSGKTCLAIELATAMPGLTILDTPSIVAASSRMAHPDDGIIEEEVEEDETSLQMRDREAAHRILMRNSGGIFKVKEPLPLVDTLLQRVSQVSDLMVTFNVAAFTDLEGFLIGVARMQGRLKKGSVPDTIAACRHILRGWSEGEIGYYSKPPDNLARVEEARRMIENDASLKGLCLHRREWRQRWSGKELRLTTGKKGMFGDAKLAFSRSIDDVEEEDDEDGDEDDDEEDDEEEEGQEEQEEERETDEEMRDSDPNADTDEDPQEESD